jgi:glycine betaine/choline ABC-type transport system substrate-binding protein
MTNGGLCSFTQGGLSLDFGQDADTSLLPSVQIPLSLAVACSSAYPVLFNPIRVGPEILGKENGAERRLSDGGIFDNLGVRKLFQLARNLNQESSTETQNSQEHPPLKQLVISDASGAFEESWLSKSGGLVSTAVRSSDILMNRIYDLERERLLSNTFGEDQHPEVFDIRIAATYDNENHAIPEAIQKQMKYIRTDLDSFSIDEQRALCCHGYSVCKEVYTFQKVTDCSPSQTSGDVDLFNVSPKDCNETIDDTHANFDFEYCQTANKVKLAKALRKSQNRKLKIASTEDWVWLKQILGFFFLLAGLFWATNFGIGQLWSVAFPAKQEIVIAGKQFEESSILVEIMAQLIENDAPNIDVKRRFYHGQNSELFYDLAYGQIDIYPEYTGTVLSIVLASKLEVARSKSENEIETLNERLRNHDRAKNVMFLDKFGFDNPYVMAMLSSKAEEWGFPDGINLEQFAKKADRSLRYGCTPTFISRPDCLANLRETYGIEFGVVNDMSHPNKFELGLSEGRVDVIDAYGTDCELLDDKYVLIEDNFNAWPIYDVAPIVRRHFAENYPKAAIAISKAKDLFKNRSEMTELIKLMKEKKAAGNKIATEPGPKSAVRQIVKAFLVDKGLLKSEVQELGEKK